MARHVKVLNLKTFHQNVESDPETTLAKAIFDVVDGKTVISISSIKFGTNPAVIIVYDDS